MRRSELGYALDRKVGKPGELTARKRLTKQQELTSTNQNKFLTPCIFTSDIYFFLVPKVCIMLVPPAKESGCKYVAQSAAGL